MNKNHYDVIHTKYNNQYSTYAIRKLEMATPSQAEQESGGPTPSSTASACMTELMKLIGLPDSTFDKTGEMTLAFDSLTVTFISHGAHSISAVSYVGELAKKGDARKLLELNFIPGISRFAIEPNSSRVVSVHDWDTSKISPSEFIKGVEAFVNRVESGQKTLATK